MKTARIFKNGQSQAVRLPREFRIEGDAVYVKRRGNTVILIPMTESWDTLKNSLEKFSSDFMVERVQPEQKREKLFE